MKAPLQSALLLLSALLLGASSCESGSQVAATPADGAPAPGQRAEVAGCEAYPRDPSDGQPLYATYGAELAEELAGGWYLRFDIPTQMRAGAEKICEAYTADDSPTRHTVSERPAENADVFKEATYFADDDVFVQDGRAYDGPYRVFARGSRR